jgi:limonene-1,2-epoxide hydrolase|tara:strand:+ start:190 stop:543 length:354 start_codon:yes stop_codon:yes gene_type:complete
MSGVVSNIIKSQVVEDYLDFFENKDIESISEVISDECSLRDWNIGTVIGKENVMGIYKNIFDSVAVIDINILHIHEDITGILSCEMELTIDDELLLVVDVFEFDEDDKIKELRAYKG